jgi:hypothetical protein
MATRSCGIPLAVTICEALRQPLREELVMKSPHIVVSLMSLILMVGLAKAVPSIGDGGRGSAQLIQQAQVETRIRPLLPAGTDLQAAATGFRNFGEFALVVHASHNLEIPFHQLKARVTGPNGIPLHEAILRMRPSVNAAMEVKKAREQARRDQEG